MYKLIKMSWASCAINYPVIVMDTQTSCLSVNAKYSYAMVCL